MHVGTNDLKSPNKPEDIADEIFKLTKELNERVPTAVSGIVRRGDDLSKKGMDVNKILKDRCNQDGIHFIDNDAIDPERHLNSSKLHLNPYGTTSLSKNFINMLNSF